MSSPIDQTPVSKTSYISMRRVKWARENDLGSFKENIIKIINNWIQEHNTIFLIHRNKKPKYKYH